MPTIPPANITPSALQAALSPHAWQIAVPAGVAGVYVIAVDTDGLARAAQRLRVREALVQLVAHVLAVPAGWVAISSVPGQPPRIVLTGADGQPQSGRAPGCAISHEDRLSLAAIHLHGRVGVDLMRPQPVPDWAVLARDYLGPHEARKLATCPPARRAQALAQAWTAREASLKCRGMGLSEWPALDEGSTCHVHPLALPEGYAGALAIP